jgi:hypothetical protein
VFDQRIHRLRTSGAHVVPAEWEDPVMPLVHQAYRFALDPTPGQARQLMSHCGAARFAFNWGLSLVKQRLDQRTSDPGVPWTLAVLRREWNQAKDEVAPWWQENSKEAYSSGLDALARALANFAGSRAGRRAGRPIGFPRFNAGTAHGRRAGSPPARSAWNPTARMWSCPAWVASAPTNRLASSPAELSKARHGSCRPRSHASVGAGS